MSKKRQPRPIDAMRAQEQMRDVMRYHANAPQIPRRRTNQFNQYR